MFILSLAALALGHCLPAMPTAPKAAPPAAVRHDEQRITHQAAAVYLANQVHAEALRHANPAGTLDDIAESLPEVLPQVFREMGTAPDLAAVLLPEVTARVAAYSVVEHGRADNSDFGYVFELLADNLKHGVSPATVRADAHRVTQQLLDSDSILSLREAVRLLLRALDAEPQVTGSTVMADLPQAPRCPAAHPEDPTPCNGPVAVTILDAHNAGADGCEHHGARLLASLAGGRVYPLGTSTEGAAIRVFKAADGIRPFPWVDAPRTRDEQLSRDEVRARGEGW